ncbi:MAG: CBS domain-containing protein [Firmicutes bacterium]|nr:CBS domain-containing protein [Bacillota bacterium]
MKAKNIMEKNIVTISPDMPVKEVAKLLAEKDLTAVPVVDAKNDIIGIVSEADLIYRVAHPHLPAHVELLGGVIYLENPFELKQEMKKLTAITAGQIMTDKVLTITEDADIEDIATLMIEQDINGVPVIGEEGLVGIVTRHDLVLALAKPESETEPEEDEKDSDQEHEHEDDEDDD